MGERFSLQDRWACKRQLCWLDMHCSTSLFLRPFPAPWRPPCLRAIPASLLLLSLSFLPGLFHAHTHTHTHTYTHIFSAVPPTLHPLRTSIRPDSIPSDLI